MRRKLLLTILFLVLVTIFLFFGVKLFVSVNVPEELANIDFSLATPAPINTRPASPEIKQTGWIPTWAFSEGLSSFTAKADYFDSISPVWYELNDEGLIIPKRTGQEELTDFLAGKDIKLIPSVASFGADALHKVLNDSTKLEAHINYLKSEVDKYDYDGLDIDYESIYAEDQAEFIYLIRSLYDYLDGKQKKLTIAVMPTWTNTDLYRGLRQTREVQDLHELGLYAHEIRIMTYNLTNYNSINPGPIAPLDWQEASLRHIVTKVDRSKIFLGINQYGYDGWSENPILPEPYMSIFTNDVADKGLADAVTYKQMTERAKDKITEGISPSSQEQYLTYEYDGKTYVIYFPTASTNRLRLELAQKYGIGGVAYWRLGDEDPDSYLY